MNEALDQTRTLPQSPQQGLWLQIRRLLLQRSVRRSGVGVVHLALWSVAFALALEIRFDGSVPPEFVRSCAGGLALLLALRFGGFLATGLFDGLWRYAGLPELRKIVGSSAAATALLLGAQVAAGATWVPRGVLLGELLASIALIGGARLLIRTFHERGSENAMGKPTLIVGAGDAGESLLRDLQRMRDGARWRVAGFLDDDATKHGALVHGVPVLGAADAATLAREVRRHDIQQVILAWPTADGARTRALVRACRSLEIAVQTVPSLAERIGGGRLPATRDLDIADLLRRDPVQLDLAQVRSLLSGKVAMVTGAGGSIGGELCRQLLNFGPRTLLLLDHDENALFFIERELRARFPHAALLPLVADITDGPRIEKIFQRLRPAVVLHAAAHKHVGMMEQNASEAVRNNVLGTRTLAEAAHRARCGVFILVSTDKAVNPTSVMGATKRACELVVQQLAQRSQTRFAAVRFGNVLGSAGSVVPLFREQIARGGPVTVTHPEVSRYFMTIPEAAQLVLQASALSRSGEIFLLDMGAPVKILDLARDLIELSGLRPEVDIEIQFTGLGPAEKLTEELLLVDQSYDRTEHAQIMSLRIQPVAEEHLAGGLARLERAVGEGDDPAAREALAALVTEARLVVAEESPDVIVLESPRRHGARRGEAAVFTPAEAGRAKGSTLRW